MMKIVVATPPNFDEIDKAFNVKGKPIFFCYGDKIFNPAGAHIPEAILMHEKVHSVRQGDDPATWWTRYINDKKFRFAEELEAHRVEFTWHRTRPDAQKAIPGWRSKEQYYLTQIAQRLSSPLYGSMVSTSEAKRLISGG